MSRSLEAVLKAAKDTLVKGATSTLTSRVIFTVGNQAADADSIVSALGLASVLSHSEGLLPVPIASCSRASGKTKPELKELLQCCGLDVSDLVYLDDIDWAAWQASPPQVVLLDHNAPEGPLTSMAQHVCAILDHHADSSVCMQVTAPQQEGDWRQQALHQAACAVAALQSGECPANARALSMDASGTAGVGSTCTLVGHAYLCALQAQPEEALVPGLAQLLATVICLDTNSLKDATKTTTADAAVLHGLDAVMSGESAAGYAGLAAGAPLKTGKGALSAALTQAATAARSAKFDPVFWRELSLTQALEYDLKVRTVPGSGSGSHEGNSHTVAMASVLAPLPVLLRQREGAQAQQQLDAFAQQHSADIVVIMSLVLSPRKARQVALYVPPPSPAPCPAGEVALHTITAEDAGLQLNALRVHAAAVSHVGTPSTAPALAAAAAASAQGQQAQAVEPEMLCSSLGDAVESGRLRVWQQGKLGVSRKQLLPLLEGALRDM